MKKLYTSFLVAFAIFQSANSFAQTKELWGMTSAGGQCGAGAIFKTDGSGNNQSIQHSFFQFTGAAPSGELVEASDGKFYGMTPKGGVVDSGILFQYDPITFIYSKKIDFEGNTTGSFPVGSLIQASDGMLYGMSAFGGINGLGVLFQFDPITFLYTKKINFGGSTNGSLPAGSLVQASDGMLYGMTFLGGTNDLGVLFQYNPTTSAILKMIDFDGATTGANPWNSLIQASDGMLYGMTSTGGTNDMGILFQYNPVTNSLIKKVNFDGTSNGSNPNGSLMQASDGMLYGMTSSGGTSGLGTLFQYDPIASSITPKSDFVSVSNGQYPNGSLIQASDGMLYGMTQTGGTNGMGTLFQYDPIVSSLSKKMDFAGTINGGAPSGSLMQASNGKLYGMTSGGGAIDKGILFQFDPISSTYTKKIDFSYAVNGSNPSGDLLQASDKTLYGMSAYGGTNGLGVLFQYDPVTLTYTKKIDFDGAIYGSNPDGSLMQASDGMFYGMTLAGGANDMGVIFQYDPVTDTYTKKIDFDGTLNGYAPTGTLIQANDGALYGMTSGGGTNGMGTIFQYDPINSTITNKFNFGGVFSGNWPRASLVQALDGMIYGMTWVGGVDDMGVLFQFDPVTSIFNKKVDFNYLDGARPWGSLMQASDGKLYGMTQDGGTNDFGVLFQYDPATSNYTKEIDFYNSPLPTGSLIQASDGKLYGMGSYGTIFQYDPVISALQVTAAINGARSYGSLIEIEAPTCIANYTTSYDSFQNIFDLIVNSNSTAMAVTYHWDFGDGTTSTLAAPTHTYTVNTLYNVCMKIYTNAGDSCTYCHVIGKDNSGNVIRNAGFTINVHNSVVTNITQNLSGEGKIEVYPNPFTNQTTILFNEAQKNTSIKIMDILGKEIRTINFTGKQLIIEKGEMQKGIYFVQMIDANKNVVNKKIVVQ